MKKKEKREEKREEKKRKEKETRSKDMTDAAAQAESGTVVATITHNPRLPRPPQSPAAEKEEKEKPKDKNKNKKHKHKQDKYVDNINKVRIRCCLTSMRN